MTLPYGILSGIVAGAALALALGCTPESTAAIYPSADLSPPTLVEAGPRDERSLLLRFDEAVKPVEGSFFVEPGADLSFRAEQSELIVSFGSDQSPGADYKLAGEVDDLRGNRARFLLNFTGWNARTPKLRLSEVQTGKNGAKTRPHRDYIELEALSDGNLGGVELSWTSTVKTSSYRFSGIELQTGDFVVLHLAPEGTAEEVDELGSDIGASGGVDATPTARDLWLADAPLPDESGAVSLALRAGEAPIDGFFYSAEGKSGPLGDDKLGTMLVTLSGAGLWPLSGAAAQWEDGFRWKSSASKSLCRWGDAKGPAGWYLSASGAQTPGLANPDPALAVASQTKAVAKKLSKKVSTKRR